MATQTAIELRTFYAEEIPKALSAGILNTEPEGRTLGVHTASNTASESNDALIPKLSQSRAWIVIGQLCAINFISSFSNGLLTVGLPTISKALEIPENLLLWPSSVFFLTGGSCLLIAGSVADVIGARRVNLPGCLLVSVFILACGLARDPIQLIMFRAMQGIATALIVPSAVSIVSTRVEHGRPRNVGFASIFLAQPLGFAVGLVLGGVFVSGPGWRVGFYVGGATGFLSWLVGIWTLPADSPLGPWRGVIKKLATKTDWIGAAMASGSLAMFSYVLAMLSANTSTIKQPTNIALLTLSLALLPSFAIWMRRQEKAGKPALIPNSIWKNSAFTTVCLMILLSNAVVNCMELFCSLFFQEVQLLSALEASIRILPQVLTGTLLNFLAGVFVNKAPITPIVLLSTLLCAISPLLMATINPAWPYWYSAFWAQILAPLSVDILFTIGTLVVSSAFPEETQALAGAIFNTFAQLGTSVGLCAMSVISARVTAESEVRDKSSPQALMQGYRASFWSLFAWMLVAAGIGAVGLRKLGRIGLKRD